MDRPFSKKRRMQPEPARGYLLTTSDESKSCQGTDLRSIEVHACQVSLQAPAPLKTSPRGLTRLRHRMASSESGRTLRYVRFLDDFPVFPVNNFWPDTGIAESTTLRSTLYKRLQRRFERCALMTTDPGDLVSTPHAAVERRLTSPSSGDGAGSPLTPAAWLWRWPGRD